MHFALLRSQQTGSRELVANPLNQARAPLAHLNVRVVAVRHSQGGEKSPALVAAGPLTIPALPRLILAFPVLPFLASFSVLPAAPLLVAITLAPGGPVLLFGGLVLLRSRLNVIVNVVYIVLGGTAAGRWRTGQLLSIRHFDARFYTAC